MNATKPDPVEGSVEAQVARIIDQAQAEGLQLTRSGGHAAGHDQAGGGGCSSV